MDIHLNGVHCAYLFTVLCSMKHTYIPESWPFPPPLFFYCFSFPNWYRLQSIFKCCVMLFCHELFYCECSSQNGLSRSDTFTNVGKQVESRHMHKRDHFCWHTLFFKSLYGCGSQTTARGPVLAYWTQSLQCWPTNWSAGSFPGSQRFMMMASAPGIILEVWRSPHLKGLDSPALYFSLAKLLRLPCPSPGNILKVLL